MSAFCVGGNAGGSGTSHYLALRMQDYHHAPTSGPFEAKRYECSPGLFLSPTLSLVKYAPSPHFLNDDSLDRVVGNYASLLANSSSTMHNKPLIRSPVYFLTAEALYH